MTSLILRSQNDLRNTGSRTGSRFFIDDFENLVDRFFNTYPTYPGGENNVNMPIELIERDNNLIMRVMIPGMNKEDINIEVSEDQVNISGEAKCRYEEEKDLIHRSEFCVGKFARTIALPQKINNKNAKADYKDGILTLTLPKSEKEINKIVKVNL